MKEECERQIRCLLYPLCLVGSEGALKAFIGNLYVGGC